MSGITETAATIATANAAIRRSRLFKVNPAKRFRVISISPQFSSEAKFLLRQRIFFGGYCGLAGSA
jgi:hypothetical protein